MQKKFSWRLFGSGRWRLTWTSPARRPVTIVDAANAGVFHPLPLEPPYRRQRPRIEAASAEFQGAIDGFCASPAQPPPGGLAVLSEVCAVAGGVLVTRDGEIVAESLANSEDMRRFRPFRRRAGGALTVSVWPLTPVRFMKGDYIYLQQMFDGNYGHWLVELLPRIAVAAQFADLSRFKLAITGRKGGMGRVILDSLALFGVKPEQVVQIDRGPVLFERLLFPLPVARHPWVKSPNAIAVLESLPDRAGAKRDGPKRLYVTRNADKNRRLANEDDLVALLQPLGFVVVEPGSLSFADQMRIFAGAELIVGNCGAGLTNLVFAPRGVRVLALTTPFMQDDFFWDLTDLKQGRFYSQHGDALNSAQGSKSDFSIDPAAFKLLLAELIETG